MEVPMLDEWEWAEISPLLSNIVSEIKQYREIHQVSLAEAKAQGAGRSALMRYLQITGFHEKNVDALFHHRLSLLGPACTACSKPLRTPLAKYCAECGTPLQNELD